MFAASFHPNSRGCSFLLFTIRPIRSSDPVKRQNHTLSPPMPFARSVATTAVSTFICTIPTCRFMKCSLGCCINASRPNTCPSFRTGMSLLLVARGRFVRNSEIQAQESGPTATRRFAICSPLFSARLPLGSRNRHGHPCSKRGTGFPMKDDLSEHCNSRNRVPFLHACDNPSFSRCAGLDRAARG